MKKFLILVFLSALSLKILSQDIDPIAQHFVVIGCDGMSPDGIRNAATPNMDDMIENGAYTFTARAVLPTSSSSNWASMLMGAGPEQHGITSNGWEKDDFILPPVISGPGDIFPTIFSVLKKNNSEIKTAAVYHWKGFGRLFEKESVDYDVNGKTETETVELAEKYFIENKPDFAFIHLDHVDAAGHEFGHGTEKYFKSIEFADELIGKIIEAAKKAGMFENTVFLVTSDHGGIGYGHGGETLEEIEIPFILFGKGIKKGYAIKHPVYTYDNAATVAFALGYKQPYAWIGRAVKSAFIGYESPEVNYIKPTLPTPVISPEKKFYEPAGGLFIDEKPVLKINSDIERGEIRFTLDGNDPIRSSALYSEPLKINKSAVVKAKLFAGNEQSRTTTAFFRIAESSSDNGIKYKYYEVDGLKSLPVFFNLTPLKTGNAFEIRYGDIPNRKENFAVEFEGYIKIDSPGKYKFYTYSDDGSKLYINDEEIVDNDGDHGTRERSGTINLSKGMHKIKVTYFNGYGGAWLDVFYRGPGITKQIIPPDVLFLSH